MSNWVMPRMKRFISIYFKVFPKLSEGPIVNYLKKLWINSLVPFSVLSVTWINYSEQPQKCQQYALLNYENIKRKKIRWYLLPLSPLAALFCLYYHPRCYKVRDVWHMKYVTVWSLYRTNTQDERVFQCGRKRFKVW